VEDSKSEAIIRGPKDSFTENYMINIGLIRKRIKDNNLVFDELKIGRRTKTKISITYINNIVEEKYIKNIKEKLKKLDVDGLIDSGPIRDYLTKENHCAFPTIISTERPDKCTQSLLDGKIIIIVENTPFALIIPGMFIDIFHTPEDNYQQPVNITITRILKFIGFIITLFTPAIYIALTTYNFEIIPDNLLISIAIQRQGVPFPTVIETIIMLITFEILRESDIRLPNQMGAAVSIVGALVLGDAAVKAGIVSPIVIIVVAITSVSGLLFTDIDVVNGIRIWRFILILSATLLGLIGLVIATIMFITKLSSLEILDIPYLSTISPFNLQAQKNAIIKYPKTKIKTRPFYLKTKQKRKVGEK
jgi:spore germination protein KA